MKGLRVGDRVRTRGQQYHFAYCWGTAVILEVSNEEYKVRHDANTRLGIDGVSEDWHPQHHILLADVQIRDTVFDFIPFISGKDGNRLCEIGYIKDVHFRLGSEEAAAIDDLLNN